MLIINMDKYQPGYITSLIANNSDVVAVENRDYVEEVVFFKKTLLSIMSVVVDGADETSDTSSCTRSSHCCWFTSAPFPGSRSSTFIFS